MCHVYGTSGQALTRSVTEVKLNTYSMVAHHRVAKSLNVQPSVNQTPSSNIVSHLDVGILLLDEDERLRNKP